MRHLTWHSGRTMARATIFATFVVGGLAGLIGHHATVVAAALAATIGRL